MPRPRWPGCPGQRGVIRERFAYAPAQPRPPAAGPAPEPGDLMSRAARHGDEHVIKLTDTVLDIYARSGNPAVLSAATRCADLIDPPR